MIEPKYKCGECGSIHDDKDDAIECWLDCVRYSPDVNKVFLCPVCNDEHSSEEDAIECHEFNVDNPPPPTAKELEAAGQMRLLP